MFSFTTKIQDFSLVARRRSRTFFGMQNAIADQIQ
jgi:hypothetical protein